MTPCGPTWHRLAVDDRDHIWFRLAVRMNDQQGTYIYRLGPEPDDDQCRAIWCYGDKGVPWTCAACGQVISADRYRPDKAVRQRRAARRSS
jgi:hypothetical protein